MLYLADLVDTAIAETRYHQEKCFRAIEGLHYDTVDMRCFKVTFSAKLINAVSVDEIDTINDYAASRVFGAELNKAKEAGLQYRSVGNKGSICRGLLSPAYVESAIQRKHFEFVFDGDCISKVRELTMN